MIVFLKGYIAHCVCGVGAVNELKLRRKKNSREIIPLESAWNWLTRIESRYVGSNAFVIVKLEISVFLGWF